ncbi:MAG TPA: hypothetical protein VEC60_08965, partial [Reyranella sp.]|nr:hypothetical protein [Reyranella sp.]
MNEAWEIAHEAGKTGALALTMLGARLRLPDAAATALASQANLIATVLTPRIETPGAAAAIGRILAEQAIAAGTAMQSIDGGPREAATAFYDAASYLTTGLPPTISPAKQRAGVLARAVLACGEAAFLGQAFLAEARSDFTDRRSAVEARGRIAAALEEASDRIAAAAGADIHAILGRAARHATDFLIAEASELRPVVRVEAARSLPSSALAWALYGDPARAGELAERNRCGTPLFMPATI